MQSGSVTPVPSLLLFLTWGGHLNAQRKNKTIKDNRIILHCMAFITPYFNYFVTYLFLHQCARCLSPGNTPSASALQILVSFPFLLHREQVLMTPRVKREKGKQRVRSCSRCQVGAAGVDSYL